MTKPRFRRQVFSLVRITATLLGLLVSGTLAWAGTWTLFQGLAPALDPLVRGSVGFAVAFLTMMATAWTLAALGGRRRPDVFGPFNEALLRISRGDYKVQLPVGEAREGGPAEAFQTLAENLNTMTGALARMEDLRRQFVDDVSHEFQSPLTSILGFAQALRTGDLPEEQRARYLSIIESEARRLSRMSASLLKLNALEDHQSPPDPVSFRLDVQIRSALVSLEPQWSAMALAVEADLPEVEVTGNEGLWSQVWTNLIHNAVKFTPEGGRITVRMVPGPPPVIEIEDTGNGLSADQVPRVFERFYKADAARSFVEGVSGSGLGLALVQRIVALHGGRVEALSPGLGLGTTLRVVFGPK